MHNVALCFPVFCLYHEFPVSSYDLFNHILQENFTNTGQSYDCSDTFEVFRAYI